MSDETNTDFPSSADRAVDSLHRIDEKVNRLREDRLNNIPGLIDVLNLPEYTYPVLGLAIGKPDQNPTVKPRMPRTMQFFENTYPADADGVLDQLPAFDEEVHRYYDLRQADRPVDAFSDQVATISQQDVSHQTLLDKAAAQGFRLDQ